MSCLHHLVATSGCFVSHPKPDDVARQAPCLSHCNFQTWSESLAFSTFDFEMGCFVAHGRAMLRHPNFQKWFQHDLRWTFSSDLEMCLPPQQCAILPHPNFPRSGPNMLCFGHFEFLILTSNFVLRNNGVQLFISRLPSWLRTCRLSEPSFSTRPTHKSLEHNLQSS